MSTTGSPPIQSPALIALASSSVAHVTTRSARSLSSAASTVFWCVSGTLRIQPSGSFVLPPRASRNVSLSVSMISGAGIDSGIRASREKIDLSYANRREERIPPMFKAFALAAVLILTAVAVSGAAGPELKTDDQKTLYALGLVISQNLANFNLSAADLEPVLAGLSDGVLKKESKVDVQTYAPKISQLQASRAGAAAATEKKAGQAFLDKAAAEKGATRTPSGLIITTLKPGTGPSPKATDKVKVHYHGTLTDGTVFDSSVQRGQPIELPLNGVIKCWTEGVQMMKVGGKSKLVCPSDLAYGDQGRPPQIKPGATLVFEVELLDIVK